MQLSNRLMRQVIGVGFSTLLLFGCQDMLSEGSRNATDADLQLNAQQGLSDEKVDQEHHEALDTVAACKELQAKLNSKEIIAHEDLYLQVKNRFVELNCFAVVATVDPVTPPKEPSLDEICHNLKTTLGTLGTDNPKYPLYLAEYQAHCQESKVTEEKPTCHLPDSPKEEPKISVAQSDAVDTVGTCKALHEKMGLKEVNESIELYMQFKNRFSELNCFAVIGAIQPATPPKEPTQDEICLNLKTSIAELTALGNYPAKLESYQAEYQAHCVTK